MAELVRVAHDSDGLDPAIDDIHREHVPHPQLGLVLRSRSGWASGGKVVHHPRGEVLRLDVTGLQELKSFLDCEPFGLAVQRLLARAAPR